MNSANPLEVFMVFLRLGLTSFGGPIAHLSYFRQEFVEKRQWVNDSQFGQLLAICQFLPGPASSQLGFTMGLLRAGWLGAIAAFVAFTLPSAVLLIVFASFLPYFSGEIGEAAIHGLKLVAFAVVAHALLGMSKQLCPDKERITIATVAAVLVLVVNFALMQLLVVLAGGIAGMLFCQHVKPAANNNLSIHYGASLGWIFIGLFLLLLFVLPFMAMDKTLAVVNAFYQAGALVFGGGHVVLPLLEDSVVNQGWISEGEFLAGYGAAQAVPGPMFSFAAYLGFVLGDGQGGVITAFIALLSIFLPGFLLVAGVLPLWQLISSGVFAARAIAGINAAVVGILGAALYNPVFTSAIHTEVDMAIAIVALILLTAWRLSALYVVVWCVIASVAKTLL